MDMGLWYKQNISLYKNQDAVGQSTNLYGGSTIFTGH